MLYKFLNVLIIVSFACSLVVPIPQAHADSFLGLPEPGTMVNLSPAYEPMLIKGLKINPENPFKLDFIIDAGGNHTINAASSSKLIKYFLAAMTVPEKDLWVNLSPYEKNRMIAPNLAQTEMGRDMLAQDYILKQLTASLIYPEKELGKAFWENVYAKARLLYGTTKIPVNTFNKVWIIAQKADVYEHDNSAYVVGAHLKVMLEEDYLALEKGLKVKAPQVNNLTHSISSNIIRQIILPQLEIEINKGKNFAPLRQIFYSMILASWYKIALKDALLSQLYGNQSKVKVGINQDDPKINEEIFSRYLQAYKKGVFNYIKEDIDTINPEPVPRKYFSGGECFAMLGTEGKILKRITDPSQISAEDSLGSGNLWDAAITVDPAKLAPKHKNYLKTVIWLSKKKNLEGMPEVRYTRISTLTVGPYEEEAFLKGIRDNKDIVILNERTVKKSKRGNIKIRLNEKKGIIPEKYKGQKVILSGNVSEMLPDFETSMDGLYEKLNGAQEIAVRVNEVFRVLVHDRAGDRYLYFLPFNKTAMDQGKLRLSALGGGVRFKVGGLEYYRQHVDPHMRTIKGEPEDDVRVVIYRDNLEKMLARLNEDDHIEDNVDHELEDELNGENGLFPLGVPKQWLSDKKQPPLSIKGQQRLQSESQRRYMKESFEGKEHRLAPAQEIDISLLFDKVGRFKSGIYGADGETKITAGVAHKFGFNHPQKVWVMGKIRDEKNQVWMLLRVLHDNQEYLFKGNWADGHWTCVPMDLNKKGKLKVYEEEIIPDETPVQLLEDPFHRLDRWIAANVPVKGQNKKRVNVSLSDLARRYGFTAAKSIERRIRSRGIEAPPSSKAMVSISGYPDPTGGIDFSSSRMQMGLHQVGQGVQMRFNHAMIDRIKNRGFDGFEFKIESIVPFTNLPLLLGFESNIPRHHILI